VIELSTNWAENSMRPIAIGRRYVHSRIMYSLPASVRQQAERSPRSSALLACVENLPRLANCA